MPDPIEVVIARRKRTARDHIATVLFVAAYVVAMKVAEDVQTGAWQHSNVRLRLLSVRDRLYAVRDDVQATDEFRAAVRKTLDNLYTTEEVES